MWDDDAARKCKRRWPTSCTYFRKEVGGSCAETILGYAEPRRTYLGGLALASAW